MGGCAILQVAGAVITANVLPYDDEDGGLRRTYAAILFCISTLYFLVEKIE